MKTMIVRLFVLTLVLGSAAGAFAQKADKPAKGGIMAKVVQITDEQIVVNIPGKKGQPAKEETYTVSADTTVELEKNPAQLSDVKPGMTVAIKLGEDNAVKSLSAMYPRITGTLVRVEAEALVLLVKQGKAKSEVMVAIAPDPQVQIDKEMNASLTDLKPGMTVTVPKIDSPVDTVVAKTPGTKKPKKVDTGEAEGGADSNE